MLAGWKSVTPFIILSISFSASNISFSLYANHPTHTYGSATDAQQKRKKCFICMLILEPSFCLLCCWFYHHKYHQLIMISIFVFTKLAWLSVSEQWLYIGGTTCHFSFIWTSPAHRPIVPWMLLIEKYLNLLLLCNCFRCNN